jgi:hypothetical protein
MKLLLALLLLLLWWLLPAWSTALVASAGGWHTRSWGSEQLQQRPGLLL